MASAMLIREILDFLSMSNNYISAVQNKVKTLQGLDDRKKRRWLVGLSAVSMLAVLGLWTVYINISVPKVYNPGAGEGAAEKMRGGEKLGVAAGFKRGVDRIYDGLESQAAALVLGAKRAIEAATDQTRRSRDYEVGGGNLDLEKEESSR